MGGNDKLKPSDLNDWEIPGGFGATSSWIPDNPVRVLLFMTPPGAECTTGAFEKHRVWPNGDTSSRQPEVG
jgi:hypothetical protein